MSKAIDGSGGLPAQLVDALSGGLLYPVLGLEVLVLAAALLDAGAVCWELVAHPRRPGRAALDLVVADARHLLEEQGAERAGERLAEVSDTALWRSFSRAFRRLPAAEPARLACLYEETESHAARADVRSHLLCRTAPVLGLLGALLSLGAATAGVGDAALWSRDVRTGVSALALGLLAWIIGYATSMVRGRRNERELADVRYVLEGLVGDRLVRGIDGDTTAQRAGSRPGVTDTALLLGAAAVMATILGFSSAAGRLPGAATDPRGAYDKITIDALSVASSIDDGKAVGTLLRKSDGSVAWLPGEVGVLPAATATDTIVVATTTAAVAETTSEPVTAKTTNDTSAKKIKDTGSKSEATPEEASSDAVVADINVDDPNVDDPSVDGDLGE